MTTLLAVGDVMLGRRVAEEARAAGDLYPFEHVIPGLKRGDVVLGNLETALSVRGVPNARKPADLLLRADPSMASRLKRAGFNALSVANNHMFDYGKEAFEDTIRLLGQEGIGYVGAGSSEREARSPLLLEAGGLVIGLLAYTYGYPARADRAGCAFRDPAAMEADVSSLRRVADIVVVSLHDGIEFVDYPTPRVRVLAHALIDWGADLVLGHHPHTLQGIEEYGSGLIAYSLGDFVFDNADDEIRRAAYRRTAVSLLKKPLPMNDLRPLEAVILECCLSKGGVDTHRAIPLRIGEDFQPRPAEKGQGAAIMERLVSISEPLGNPDHPVWSEMVWLERETKKLSLANASPVQLLRRLRRFRPSDLVGVPLLLSAKLSKLFRGRWRLGQ